MLRSGDERSNRRPRVLVCVTYGLGVRYLLPTGVLDLLRESVDLLVGVGWDAPELLDELDGRGMCSVRLPDAVLDGPYRRHRRQMDLVHQKRLRSPTSAIHRRALDVTAEGVPVRILGDLRRFRDRVVVSRPGGASRIEAAEVGLLEDGTNLAEFRRFLLGLEVDLLVVVTPYHEQDSLLLSAAADLGIRSVTSVISFDNPTARRRFPVVSDRILVWNSHNRSELLRSYPGLEESRLGVIGAPQFDLHHRSGLILDEATWRRRTGLPPDRPVILYGGGPSLLVPDEPRLVRLIDDLIESGQIAGRPVLLARRHPADDPGPWHALRAVLRHGVAVDPWEPGGDPNRGWPTTADLKMQMSSFAHSAVHVNVSSSMTLDGAVFDRPQIGPMFVPGIGSDGNRRIRDLYAREHWWPITASGGLVTVDSPTALGHALDDAIRDPTRGHEGRRRMVEDLLTTDDGRASERLVGEILAVAGSPALTGDAAPEGGRR